MTSRERVLAAIFHRPADKVPVDLGATPSSGISAIAYSNLLQRLGREELPILVYDVVQQLAQPDQSVMDLFGVDVIDVARAFDTEPSDWKPTVLANGAKAYYPAFFNPVAQPDGSYSCFDSDGVRMLARMPVGATFFDQTYFPFIDAYPSDYSRLGDAMDKVMWSRYTTGPWHHGGEDGFWEELRAKCISLRETTDKALMICCGCNLFEWGTFMRRMDNFLMDLYLEPDEVEKFLDALLEKHFATLEKVCRYVGDVVDIIRFGDDLGTMTGPFMDPDTYRRFFKPRLRQLCDYVKTHSTMHTFLHSCGSISMLMPDIIDAGIEILNPVQTNARNMAPEFLKKEFGADVTFWGGGIENVGVLNGDDTAKIREQVLERMEILSAGGGFVFNTVHNILPDVPAGNVLAMFDAVKEFNSK